MVEADPVIEIDEVIFPAVGVKSAEVFAELFHFLVKEAEAGFRVDEFAFFPVQDMGTDDADLLAGHVIEIFADLRFLIAVAGAGFIFSFSFVTEVSDQAADALREDRAGEAGKGADHDDGIVFGHKQK